MNKYVSWILGTLFFLGAVSAGETGGATALIQGQPQERELAADGSHDYSLDLANGRFLHARVTQLGIDVVVSLFGPNGEKVLEVDAPTGARGPEDVRTELATPGAYRLNVRPFDGSGPGRYRVEIVEVLDNAAFEALQEEKRKQSAAAVAWFRERAIPLTTVEAGNGFADLMPLKGIVGDARVVSLGEATHGTREFFQLKHRMLEFLVEEMGFNIFAIEATMPESYDINRYVLTGEGDARSVMAGIYFWTWNTEEVLAQVEWMRAYNADPSHERKIQFYGFDMQSPARAIVLARRYLEKVDPEAVAATEALQPLFLPRTMASPDEAGYQALIKAADDLAGHFEKHKAAYAGQSGERSWAEARQEVEVVRQYLKMASGAGMDGFRARDTAMAANIRWILEHEGPDAKIVAWAHNGHVMRQQGRMGAYLNDLLGDQVRVFGFAFNQGGFQAVDGGDRSGLKPFVIEPAQEDSLDAVLAGTGHKLAAFDVREDPGKSGSTWFADLRATRSIGALYTENRPVYALEKTWELYDALLFVETTTRAVPIEGFDVWPTPEPLPEAANLGFEDGAPGEMPAPWAIAGRSDRYGYRLEIVAGDQHGGQTCGRFYRQAGIRIGELGGTLQQVVAAEPWRGKHLRFKAWIRTHHTEQYDGAYLFLRTAGGAAPQATLSETPIRCEAWQHFQVETKVPDDATSITFGLFLAGSGQVWLDDLSMEEAR